MTDPDADTRSTADDPEHRPPSSPFGIRLAHQFNRLMTGLKAILVLASHHLAALRGGSP